MSSSRFAASVIAVFAILVLLPAAARAQSAIAGTVKDTSGAVLPGVTVEAASPVLIEKVRSVTTNDQGQFTIVDSAPRRVHGDVHVARVQHARARRASSCRRTSPRRSTPRCGSALLEETVTVTGESPVVDVSSTAQVQVLTREVLDAIPTGRRSRAWRS